jgi:phytoene dehydrogenase-like protein
MPRPGRREAFVIGSGPNGLTAAITLARAGLAVTVLEAQSTVGGGIRSAQLTLPGFTHDICSAVHPMAISSPIFATMPLREHGLEWIQPPIAVAHPLDGGDAATLDNLGEVAAAFHREMRFLGVHWNELLQDILAPPHIPKHPLVLARFGLLSVWSASRVARTLFRGEQARTFFAGMAAHSILPLEMPGSAAFGWVLALAAKAVGWPIPRGGSQYIASALASYFELLGGLMQTNHEIRSLRELPPNALVLCDVTPRQLLKIAGDRLPASYCEKLQRYRYGPGVFKMDWALNSPIPWRNADCKRAATIHLGGSLDEIALSERAAWTGSSSRRPFVLLAQPSLFDGSRAPTGKHTAWAYCHVPNGSSEDMTHAIETQVERFAPGFHSAIMARHVSPPAALEAHNANLVGGDINGGAANLGQLFLRPTRSLYRTPIPGLFLCSSSTPPGGGVHGMCGFHAANAALSGITSFP